MNDEYLEDDFDEGLADLEDVQDWSSGAALWSTDWTAETIVSQLKRGNIDLEPSFQRRSAWREQKESLFIESLILGIPIPQLILADSKIKRGSYIVIDGKQRLLTIRKFVSSGEHGAFEPLRLSGLEKRKDLNGITYTDLLDNTDFEEDLAAFQNSNIRTIVIRNWKRDTYLYEVFLRINTGSVKLAPQELRQALFPGPFSTFIENASGNSIELRQALNLEAPDFRMRDAEVLLRYIAYKNFIQDYRGSLKNFLDATTSTLSGEWLTCHEQIEGQVSEMERALSFTRNAFGDDKYIRKWNGEQFETRINRAVLDIMVHYFSEEEVRNGLQDKEQELVENFKNLCEQNTEFLSSIETTTKSITANKTRFNLWGDVVAELSGVNIDPLKFPE